MREQACRMVRIGDIVESSFMATEAGFGGADVAALVAIAASRFAVAFDQREIGGMVERCAVPGGNARLVAA